jgi:hypothetical protein
MAEVLRPASEWKAVMRAVEEFIRVERKTGEQVN